MKTAAISLGAMAVAIGVLSGSAAWGASVAGADALASDSATQGLDASTPPPPGPVADSSTPPDPAAPSPATPPHPPLAASPPSDVGPTPIHDPLEPLNRRLFSFSEGLDKAVIRPVALGYKRVLPKPVRKGVGNVLNNLGEPVTFFNDVLQLRVHRADQTAARFLLNSTIGLLGIFDFAGSRGIPIHYSDFGQTLGRYGVKPGPFLYIPVLGPSDFRDGFGRIADVYADPIGWHDLHVDVGVRIGLAVLNGIDTRANIDDTLQDLKHSATDEYAALRSAFLQNRQAKITDQKTAVQQLPDFDAPPSGPLPAKKP